MTARLSGRVIRLRGDCMADYFICATDSGLSMIAYAEVAAITTRSVGSSVRYDIHMKSGTIFTTSDITQRLKEMMEGAD